MATFKIGLGITETGDSARFEVSGSDAWIKEIMPHIGLFLGSVIKSQGQDLENAVAVGGELAEAEKALKNDQDFCGKFVTVTRAVK